MAILDEILVALAFAAALGSGLMAGVFFAFSAFIMRALARLPAPAGLAAMQSINVTVINPLFLGVFMGTAAACVAVIAGAVARWDSAAGPYLLAGSALYLAGTFGVTIVCNVPLNNSMAAITPADADGAERWADYIRRWTAWNHVRTAAALAALAAFVVALWR